MARLMRAQGASLNEVALALRFKGGRASVAHISHMVSGGGYFVQVREPRPIPRMNRVHVPGSPGHSAEVWAYRRRIARRAKSWPDLFRPLGLSPEAGNHELWVRKGAVPRGYALRRTSSTRSAADSSEPTAPQRTRGPKRPTRSPP